MNFIFRKWKPSSSRGKLKFQFGKFPNPSIDWSKVITWFEDIQHGRTVKKTFCIWEEILSFLIVLRMAEEVDFNKLPLEERVQHKVSIIYVLFG
jgi:hypothetical protein